MSNKDDEVPILNLSKDQFEFICNQGTKDKNGKIFLTKDQLTEALNKIKNELGI